MPRVAAEFDEIAEALRVAPADRPPSRPERFLLDRAVDAAWATPGRRALDVGCGDGWLTRALADRGIETLGIDVSPKMIALAAERSARSPGATYRVADVMRAETLPTPFDLVVSVATIHHLPLGAALARLTALVAPGGTLVVQDVMTRPGLGELPANVLAWLARRLAGGYRARDDVARVDTLYARHGAGESYLTAANVVAAYRALLPAARVYRHLEWRYTVVWRRPA